MFLLPNFVYRILENRVGRTVAYILLFAAIFAIIVMVLAHLENSAGQ